MSMSKKFVPPADDEVEVCITQVRIIDRPVPSEWLEPDQEGINRARDNIRHNRELGSNLQYEIRELVDRAHVIRLQTEAFELRTALQVANKNNKQVIAERDEQEAKLFKVRQDLKEQVEITIVMSRQASDFHALADERKAKLTQARELLEDPYTSVEDVQRFLYPELYSQSASSAKEKPNE